MTLRRATVLASLIIYLGVGMCRQTCALDIPPLPAVAAANANHCHDETPPSGSRRGTAPCCMLSVQDASVLLPAQAAILPATASSVVAAIDAALMIPDAATPSELAARAPPGAAPSVRAPALHGPRAPPPFLAVL